jgi:hypothetical protein
MTTMPTHDSPTRASLLAAVLVCIAGCAAPEPDPPDAPPGAALYWLGSDADALVKCSVASQCGDGGANYGTLPGLSVGGGELEHSRSYVRFYMPLFPPGTAVVRAQLELFHGGEREDGTTDEVCLDVARAPAAWSPLQVTWNDQPLSSTSGGEAKLSLVSRGWSAADVTAVVVDHVADPASNDGFVVLAPATAQLRKGFDSNAHPSRTADDLGRAPRLLLEVAPPSDGEPSWPEAFPDDTDLPFPGQRIAVAEAAAGEDWPVDWEAASTSRCGP